MAGIRERLHAAADALVARARDAGAVRPTSPAPDLLRRYLEIHRRRAAATLRP
ncbi:hypothetical protein [Pseudonocardia sp. NPDC046786]|uniref:hypothetical protein n=1 Tax=Pseudonocardia sp. NPDC046786 TaxID=3155471 RepID=UPI0033CEB3C8